MKILILNYYHYPAAGAHAFRWSALSEHFAKLGHEVTVVTSPVKGSPKREFCKGVTILRVGVKKLDIKLHTDFEKKTQFSTRALRLVKAALRPIYRFFYWPDALWHWAPFLLYELFRNHKDDYDVIVSYYPSFVSHISAYIFKRFRNNKSKWVMDYGDPFSISQNWQPNNYCIFKKINLLVEGVFFSKSIQSFTNSQTLEEYRRFLPIKNSLVISNMVNIEDFYNQNQDQNISLSREKKTIIISFVGAFYKNFREPYFLIALLEKLNKRSEYRFILNIFGPDHGFSYFFKNYDFVKYFGPVTRQDARYIIKNSHILANVENRDCVMTPSKVVEYIASGRPILNILNGEPDYAPKLAYELLGYLINVDEGIEEIQFAYLEKKIISLSSLKSLDINKVYSCLHPSHTLEGVACQYLKIFERPVELC